MPISGTARLDAGAHDWPHRHAAATRTIRQATDTTTPTTCPPPPTGPWSPWSWPAAVVDCSTPVQYILLLLFSPVSPAPRRWRRQRGGVRGLRCQARSVSAARQHLATKHCYHHVAQQAERPAQSGSSTSAPFWAALVPHGSSCSSLVLYTSDACMQPTMQATRREAQPRCPSAHSAWPLSCISRPSRFARQHQHFWQRLSRPLDNANHGRISILAPYLTFRSCRPSGASIGQRRPELPRPDLPRAPPTLNRARASLH